MHDVPARGDERSSPDKKGEERPAKRSSRTGETIYNVRYECQLENVLGRIAFGGVS